MRDARLRALFQGAALLVLGSAVLPAPAAAQPAVSRQFHGLPTHQGFNRHEHTIGVGNVASLSLEWIGLGDFSEFGTVFNSSPAIADGVAYFGDTNGTLYAFSADGCGSDSCQP